MNVMVIQTPTMSDPHNLERFKSAQDAVYHCVISELSEGKKRSHWMWFVFPQIDGLGSSPTAKEYAIKCREEALAYLEDPLLGDRLRECSQLALNIEGKTATEILGSPDDLKLRSSMTLFAEVAGENPVFQQVLDKYYDGEADPLTLSLLSSSELV